MRLLLVFFALAAAGIPAPSPLEIQIVYDNTSTRKDLIPDWGISALVKFRGRTLLFDTGAKPEIFTANLHRLGIRPESIERVVISHEHP
ncbi:MAG TPA: hypothetical protein VMZ52_07210, partial [Bryobacteraceae bacterium]|nr:hypothetical protein [Bryobacteraceae bacterium]